MNYFLLLFSLINIQTSTLHQYHVSKCMIHYKTAEQALQISLHFFIDDMELVLQEKSNSPLFLGTEKESEEAQALLLAYLRENLTFIHERKQLEYEWIGRETSEDMSGIWCYMEIPNLAPPKRMKITNRLLLEAFSDQKNLLSLNFDNIGEVYYLFRNGKDQEEIFFPN